MVDGQRAFVLKALSALMVGIMLGVLMGVPHEEMLGLSVPLYSALQSLVSTATFVGLTTDWPVEVILER
jgi:small basic protein